MDEVAYHGIGSKVGCIDHQNKLTKYIMKFYVNTRMIFACKKHNNQVSDKKKMKFKKKFYTSMKYEFYVHTYNLRPKIIIKGIFIL